MKCNTIAARRRREEIQKELSKRRQKTVELIAARRKGLQMSEQPVKQTRPTAQEIMNRRTVDEYMSWAIETAGNQSPHRRPRWSHVADIFGNGSGVSQALCIKYGHDPDEIMGLEWTDSCPTCGTEFEE